MTDASNKGWGALCEGKPTYGLWSKEELLRNASSITGTPCASTLRQNVRGVIHKSPGWPRLEVTLHAGEQPSCVGPEQSALAEGDACAGQNEPRSRHVVEKQRLFRGMDASPAHGSENLGNLWQGSSRPLRLQRQLSLPNLFYKKHGYHSPFCLIAIFRVHFTIIVQAPSFPWAVHKLNALHRPCAPRTQSFQMSFTLVLGNHGPWVQQWKTRSRPWATTPPPPLVFEISTHNRFTPLRETERGTVII